MDSLVQIKEILYKNHGGPGPHKDGSSQDVHGGGRGSGVESSDSSGSGSAGQYGQFKEKKYKVPKNAHPAPSTGTQMTFTPEEGGYLFHGTRMGDTEEYPFADSDGVVFFTDDFLEAAGYAQGLHLGGRGNGTPRVMQAQLTPGKMADVSSAIDQEIFEGDGDLGLVFKAARDQGFDYAFYTHPTFSSENDEQRVIVALNPGDQVGSLNTGWSVESGKLWHRPRNRTRGWSNQELNNIRLVLSHGGPGPHPSGSSQDVHGKKGAGSTSTSTTASVQYNKRAGTLADYDSLISGSGNPDMWNRNQAMSASLYDEGTSDVLVDSQGKVQAHYTAKLIDQELILELYEMNRFDLEDYSDVGQQPFEVMTLGVAPRNLGESGGERGWGLHAMHEVIKDARAAGADYIFLSSTDPAKGFYENIGMLEMDDIGYPGLFVMSRYRWDKFEEAYNARFPKK